MVTAATTNLQLLEDYLTAKGKLEDPLCGTGADYVYVAIDAKAFPQGGQPQCAESWKISSTKA
jgi:hypothetical protein